MKYYRNALLALPLIFLAGCHSGSNTMKKQLPQPKADYVFSSAKLGKLYQDREELQEAFTLNYDGVQYEKVMFAEDISGQQKVIRLVDRLGQTIDMYFPDAGVDTCGIYREGDFYDEFDCNAAQRSVSNETTLIQTTTIDRKRPIEFEFYTEALEYVTRLGSTVLTRLKSLLLPRSLLKPFTEIALISQLWVSALTPR